MFNSSNIHVEEVLQLLRNQCYRRAHAIRYLIISFKSIDHNNSGYVNRAELEQAFANAGLFLSQPAVQVIFKEFKGEYLPIVDAIVGESYSRMRQDVVDQLYTLLVECGPVTKDSILSSMLFENHPLSFSGLRSPTQLRQDYFMAFDGINSDCGGNISAERFREYFRGISGSFAYLKDSEFVDFIEKVWRVRIDVIRFRTCRCNHNSPNSSYILEHTHSSL
eukprot:GDKK01062185.1.p1 GENE.GDKK01062185.1~~GDKK01062185.1.p1  ORF type:complete len:221 (+),score=17.37 GDKK01062185.1:28-690(+)